jgi:hypothetical protein
MDLAVGLPSIKVPRVPKNFGSGTSFSKWKSNPVLVFF